MDKMLLKLFMAIFMIFGIHAYPSYKDEIPNGDNVPHPCKPNYLWKAPGHENPLGGGVRNPFGKDFNAMGRKWTQELCHMDSDGDGRTNGEELGDPECIWEKGQPAPRVIGLSHPGICEPLDQCGDKNMFEVCDGEIEYNCPRVEDDPSIRELTIKLDKTAVPNTDTNYYCQSFELPHDQEYHLIGSEPVLDNELVMHHMIAFGCTDPEDPEWWKFQNPQPCGMVGGSSTCMTMLQTWALGSVGRCAKGDYGRKIGKNSIYRVILQLHWNNALLEDGLSDGSGIKLYYTPELGTYDLASFMIAKMDLEIPPGKKYHEVSGTCTSQCTKQLIPEDIKIVEANLHMHYLGREGYIEVLRDGKVIQTLVADSAYSYDSPAYHPFDPPAVIRVGDSLRVRCVFKSTNRDEVVYYGDGTQEEMCMGFINYYSPVNETMCLSYADVDTCGMTGLKNESRCDFDEFWYSHDTQNKFKAMETKCDTEKCTAECEGHLSNWYKEDVCLAHEPLRKSLINQAVHQVSPEAALQMRVCEPHVKAASPVLHINYYLLCAIIFILSVS